MMTPTPRAFGKLTGVVMDFELAGDILPMHNHGLDDAHITIVTKGSFKAHGDGWEMTLVTGNVIDWPANQPHEFIALEPNSRLVNIQKG